MENKYKLVLGAVVIFGFTSILADVPIPTDPKDAELEALLKKSEEQLHKVALVAKKVDAITTEQVVEMNESIEELQEMNEQLTEEVYEVKKVMESITTTATPFKLEPILLDTTSGGK